MQLAVRLNVVVVVGSEEEAEDVAVAIEELVEVLITQPLEHYIIDDLAVVLSEESRGVEDVIGSLFAHCSLFLLSSSVVFHVVVEKVEVVVQELLELSVESKISARLGIELVALHASVQDHLSSCVSASQELDVFVWTDFASALSAVGESIADDGHCGLSVSSIRFISY